MVRAYCAKEGNGAGGNLHLVLGNKNVQEDNVRFCLQQAEARGDSEGAELAKVLLQMTKTQRLKIASLA